MATTTFEGSEPLFLGRTLLPFPLTDVWSGSDLSDIGISHFLNLTGSPSWRAFSSGVVVSCEEDAVAEGSQRGIPASRALSVSMPRRSF